VQYTSCQHSAYSTVMNTVQYKTVGSIKVQHRQDISTIPAYGGGKNRSQYSLNCYHTVYTANSLLCGLLAVAVLLL
jgi:hypothetical protein